ncbi:ferrochelatase [Actinoplanes lobatus]|uniref:Coproporphyrin III ferrochelatase n=1 Tax=Actinoplanes lobatus TaxID=113568 RepID=A0A7W7MGP1_9ACTN|nr:ferrochelatase [Actinoplanes lobatus]MBB4749627.1 ferrochelatase [Actinoplanes lobatus]GGN78439.1 ferrochelatase [Actinoplanes lobatus]GIE38366.1 ferrochelatase [Actinoplanes lobatus]
MVYDAFVLLSFGGPEKPDDVMPFLRNVVRGRGVPDERLAEVYEHYMHFGGVSPINQQCRDLLAAIGTEFAAHDVDLPTYWGNRNWQPMLADTVARMRDDGVEHALGFATSAYGGYSSCRQYWEDIDAARAHVGPGAPRISKLRQFHDHPGFVNPHVSAVREALEELEPDRRASTRLVFTAHSVPVGMARTAGPDGGRYTAQLEETARLVHAAAAADLGYDLVWQSRSGPPHIPWLEPDINDHLALLAEKGATDVVVSPIGFVSDHLEVIWDLDNEAKETAARLGLGYSRAATPGVHPEFVAMVRQLVQERTDDQNRPALGTLPTWDVCPADCCPPPARRKAP